MLLILGPPKKWILGIFLASLVLLSATSRRLATTVAHLLYYIYWISYCSSCIKLMFVWFLCSFLEIFFIRFSLCPRLPTGGGMIYCIHIFIHINHIDVCCIFRVMVGKRHILLILFSSVWVGFGLILESELHDHFHLDESDDVIISLQLHGIIGTAQYNANLESVRNGKSSWNC